jgi:hypothetical protein
MLNLLLSILAGASALAAGHHDHPSIHGMAVVGEETIYLSHLPMFHSPHDYQVIFEVNLNEKAKATYLASKRTFAETVYTIAPESFVLPEMVENPKPFHAALYRGHFERGGEAITDVIITITRVVHFKKFDPHQPKLGSARFFLFGKGKEKFLAHEISAKPDFDQILAVEAPFEEGQRFVVLNNTNEPVNTGWIPLHPQGERAPISVKVQSLHLEEGDLSH